MRPTVHAPTPLVLVGTLLLGYAPAQEAKYEKHVNDIRAEQPFEVISASPLCQQVRAKDESIIDRREVDPATLEKDLSALIQKSDEVVVAILTDNISVIAPSGDRAVLYYDAQILRSWKGTHKPGDLLTFSMPRAALSCGSEPGNDRPSMAFVTTAGGLEWDNFGASPVALFLRQSRGAERRFTPGLRPTGGDGVQGLFGLNSKLDRDCFGPPNSRSVCNTRLDVSQERVRVPYRRDPLKQKYEGMPVPMFLKEVQSTTDTTLQSRK